MERAAGESMAVENGDMVVAILDILGF